MAAELFQQGHRLVWRFVPASNVYVHRLRRGVTMSVERYETIAGLPDDAVNSALLDEQCGESAASAGRARPTAFVGPQIPVVKRANQAMQRVQQQSYEDAVRDGFPVNGFKGLALYAPSPFQQVVSDLDHLFTPAPGSKQRGASAGQCRPPDDPAGRCNDGLECDHNVCVVPRAERTCPPFQYPTTLPGGHRVANPSALRTVKTRKYSAITGQWFETCVPDADHTVQRWIGDPDLRRYIGLALDVKQLPEPQWKAEAKRSEAEILLDPATNAPYFFQEDEDSGQLVRVYKLNSAYTPHLPANAPAAARGDQGRPPPPPPSAPSPAAAAPAAEAEDGAALLASLLREAAGSNLQNV